MKLIPAMDLIDGQCVRLYQGDWQQQEFFQLSPVQWAKTNEAAGVKRLHMVDLNGAFTGTGINEQVLRAVREAVSIPIQIGGGIRTAEQALKLIAEGFDVILGTMLFKEPEASAQLIQSFGKQIIASVDCREGQVTLDGWTHSTTVNGLEFVEYLMGQGIEKIVYTDISKDGTLSGPNLKELYNLLKTRENKVASGAKPFSLIASGGIGTLADLTRLKTLGVEEVIVGKALLKGTFTLSQALEVCHAD